MKALKVRMVLPLLTGGLFLLLDQLLKFIARSDQTTAYYLVEPWIGWEYFENTGIAFSLPLPETIVLLITPIILFGVFVYWNKKETKTPLFTFSINLIIFGALSNFLDRMLFGYTIDYIRIFTGIINVADIIIVLGILLLFIDEHART